MPAARRIDARAPESDQPDLLLTLSVLAGERYTFDELVALLGEGSMIESSVWNEAVRRGRERGQVAEARRLRLDSVGECHPGLASQREAAILGCADGARLRTWILRAPRSSDADFAGLVLDAARAET